MREALASDAGGLALAVSYAGGFAAGTFVGGQLANLLIKGDLTLQVITSSRDDALLTAIREAGFAISVLDVNGSEFGSEKYLLIAVMKSNRQKDFRKLLQNLDPHAFILANDQICIGRGCRRKEIARLPCAGCAHTVSRISTLRENPASTLDSV